jgi:quinol monooxygenase YgiN
MDSFSVSGNVELMQIDVVAHFRAKPGQEEALRSVLESLVAPTRKEDGCLRYDLFRDADHADRFTFVEEWTSRDHLRAHGQSAHIAAGRAQFPDLLAEPGWVQLITRIL